MTRYKASAIKKMNGAATVIGRFSAGTLTGGAAMAEKTAVFQKSGLKKSIANA
jgi:hypothetical protein